MVKTPEQYFEEQDFQTPVAQGDAEQQNLTPAEQAFFSKYVGTEGAKSLGMRLANIDGLADDIPEVPRLEEELKQLDQLQMIFFYVQGQLFTIPIEAVQEVIKILPTSPLPLAPPEVAGVVDLRGRVTPLLRLNQLVCVPSDDNQVDGFIIICSRKGLQVGLMIERIYNMYAIDQSKINWNVEAQICANADFLCGILDYNDKIFSIVSIDSIIDHIIDVKEEI